jgi:Spy/CpxP family protein refolding chaperone
VWTSRAGVFFLQTNKETAMRTFCAVLTLVAAMSACPKLYADDEPKGERNRVGEGLAERIQDLNFTDEQETRIADIRKEYRPKIQEEAKGLAAIVKEEVEKVEAVLTPEQKEKVQAMKEERKERRQEGLAERMTHLRDLDLSEAELTQIENIRKEYRPKIVKALEELRGILSDEQKQAREEALKAGKKRREVLASLNLTDEQKEKVHAVGKEVATLVREELDKVRNVLTAEQQAKLSELKAERREHARDRMAARIANLRELNLSSQQRTAIAEIRQEYRPKIHEAGNKLRATAREEVAMILTVIRKG